LSPFNIHINIHLYVDMYIMKIPDEITTLLDDDILNTQKISLSPFKAAFENQIDEWEAKLKLIQEVITLWVEVQK